MKTVNKANKEGLFPLLPFRAPPWRLVALPTTPLATSPALRPRFADEQAASSAPAQACRLDPGAWTTSGKKILKIQRLASSRRTQHSACRRCSPICQMSPRWGDCATFLLARSGSRVYVHGYASTYNDRVGTSVDAGPGALLGPWILGWRTFAFWMEVCSKACYTKT